MITVNRQNRNFVRISVAMAIMVLVSLFAFPLLYNLIISLSNKHTLLPEMKFVALKNFSILFSDKEFFISFKNGLTYAFFSVFFQVIFGIIVALFLKEDTKLNKVILSLLILPYLLPAVLGIVLWKWLLHSDYGLFSKFINAIFNSDIFWLSDNMIMTTMIIISVWQFSPFVILFILAKLRSINKQYYFAASIDNANNWNKFIKITLPELKYVLLTIILIRIIWMLTKFDTVWIIAGSGASLHSVQNLPVLAYRQTFNYFQQGLGAACSAILLFCILIVAISFYRKFLNE